MRVLFLGFCYPPSRLQNVGGQGGRSILVRERLIIHVCGQSRRIHGAVIRIAALKGNIIISYSRKALLLCKKMGRGRNVPLDQTQKKPKISRDKQRGDYHQWWRFDGPKEEKKYKFSIVTRRCC